MSINENSVIALCDENFNPEIFLRVLWISNVMASGGPRYIEVTQIS
jgi:hypothetical protein